MRSSKLTIGVIGAILVAFTLSAFFLLNFEGIPLYVWALSFLLLSEVVLCAGLLGVRALGANHGKTFASAGLTGILILYFISTAVSIVFTSKFVDNMNGFILLELGIIALFAILFIATLNFSARISASNRRDAEKVGTTEPKRGGF